MGTNDIPFTIDITVGGEKIGEVPTSISLPQVAPTYGEPLGIATKEQARRYRERERRILVSSSSSGWDEVTEEVMRPYLTQEVLTSPQEVQRGWERQQALQRRAEAIGERRGGVRIEEPTERLWEGHLPPD